MDDIVLCPVCQTKTKLEEKVTENSLVKAYELLFNKSVPNNVNFSDYDIHVCPHCELSFSPPMQSNFDQFYHWITNHESHSYYSDSILGRWEWLEVINYIRANDITNVLEIGCGNGTFLEYASREFPEVNFVGIDTTESSYTKSLMSGKSF